MAAAAAAAAFAVNAVTIFRGRPGALPVDDLALMACM